MTTTTFLATLLLAMTAFVAPSCNKEGDISKPVIKLIEPENGEAFRPGYDICVEMELSDDKALASFLVNIHNNFIPHNHGKSVATHDDNYNTDFDNAFSYNKSSEVLQVEEPNEVIDITGLKNAHRHIHIPEPADRAYGDYHLMVYCYDTDGNESHVVRSIKLTADAPVHDHND